MHRNYRLIDWFLLPFSFNQTYLGSLIRRINSLRNYFQKLSFIEFFPLLLHSAYLIALLQPLYLCVHSGAAAYKLALESSIILHGVLVILFSQYSSRLPSSESVWTEDTTLSLLTCTDHLSWSWTTLSTRVESSPLQRNLWNRLGGVASCKSRFAAITGLLIVVLIITSIVQLLCHSRSALFNLLPHLYVTH